MKSVSFCLLIFSILTFSSTSAQRLKKADKVIITNMQAHIAYLNGKTLQERKAGSNGEKIADEYIRKHFERWGLKPRGDQGSWYQSFGLNDGKIVLPSTFFNIDGRQLTLFKDYFPFAFSENKNAGGTVSIALAETGFPWFKDLKDIIEEETADRASVLESIRNKAIHAAGKGATALVIYSSAEGDLNFDGKDSGQTVGIPVIYITKEAFKKYCGDEGATVDIKLNVVLEEKKRTTYNVIGYADNGADSTVIAEADLENEANIAALLELARLTKNIKAKRKNYLFVAYSGEENGSSGAKYFAKHPTLNLEKVSSTLNIEALSKSEQYTNGLDLVKRSLNIMQNK